MESIKQFWDVKRAQLDAVESSLVLNELQDVIVNVRVFEASFKSIQGGVIRGYLLRPDHDLELACVIDFQGHMCSISNLYDYMPWVLEGCAVFVYDNRLQGGLSTDGVYTSYPNGNQAITLGLLDPYDYYQGRMYCDALKAIDVVRGVAGIDADKIILHGVSQGGAIALAAAALTPQKLLHVFADVPSSSNIPQRIQDASGSYRNITEFIKAHPDLEAKVLENQQYFDLVNLAPWIRSAVTCSVGGKDPVCPAHLFAPVFETIQSSKELKTYTYNGHEGGHRIHRALKINKIRSLVKP